MQILLINYKSRGSLKIAHLIHMFISKSKFLYVNAEIVNVLFNYYPCVRELGTSQEAII